MYIKFDNGIADPEIDLLEDFLSMIDKELLRIQYRIVASKDPESDWLLERSDYFVGIGFVAIQQYFNDTLITVRFSRIKLDKKTALELGQKHSSGYSCSEAINAAANYWKHEAEWRGEENIPKYAERTIQVVSDVAGTEYYLISNTLYSLTGTSPFTLSSLMPMIVDWRAAVDNRIEEMRNNANPAEAPKPA